MGDIDETKRTPLTISPVEAVLDAHALWALVEYDFTYDWEPGARQAGRKSLDTNEFGHDRAKPSPKLFAAASAQPSYSHDGDKMRQVPC